MASPPLKIRELDGSPSVTYPTHLIFPNGWLSRSGSKLTVTPPSGSGTVTVVGGGNLTSTALVTGGGTQTLQTPSATATMDASGNISSPGSASFGVGGTI